MREDDIFEVEDRTVLDYSPDYRETFIKEIKSKFAKLCKENQTLTEEYKTFVANPDNVKVKINYGYDLQLKLSSIDSKWEYDYTLDYVSSTTYKGTAHVNSVGDVSITNLESHDNWESSKMHGEDDIFLFLGGDRYYISHCKNGTLTEEINRHCVSVKDSPEINPELLKLSKKVFSYNSVLSSMEMPDRAYDESEEKLRELNRFHNPRNIKFIKINSFGANSKKVTFFPKSFTVTVVYKGVTYEQEDTALTSIKSKGEETEHYQDFKDLRTKYENKGFGKFLVFLSYAAVCTHAIILSLIFLQLFGVPDFLHLFENENSFMLKVFDRFSVLIFIITAGLTALGLFLVHLIVHNYSCTVKYNARSTLYDLEARIKSEYVKNNLKNFFKFIVIAAISGALTYVMWFLQY